MSLKRNQTRENETNWFPFGREETEIGNENSDKYKKILSTRIEKTVVWKW